MSAMHGPWSAEQCEWLRALGHEPLLNQPPGLAALPDDPLLHAVLRAAGCDPGDARAAALVAELPPVAALRGNAAAKRGVWPRLRALRGR